MKDSRLEKLAKVLTNYCAPVKKGDIVCVSAELACVDFIQAVAKEVIKKGGNVKHFVELPEIELALLKEGTQEQISQPSFRFSECAKADVWISALGTDNVYYFHNADNEKMKQRRLANKESRKLYTQRSARGELKWCLTQFPTNADAQYAGMNLEEYEQFVYEAGHLYEDDPVAKWEEIEKFQQKWVDYLDTKKELHIISKDTDITVKIEGRKWINCCGKENFPDGEIFTSPIENGVDGFITFSFPSIINGQEFENVKLEVEKGRIVKASCKNSEKLGELLSYIDTDEGSHFFGEVAIGTNYAITKHTKNILFDEKIGGSMHMAIGSAFPEAGGHNESAIHWDMINDMKQCGRIYADGELFYENGQFLKEILDKEK